MLLAVSTMLRWRLLLALLCVGCTSTAKADPNKPLTVCDLMSELAKRTGQEIAVRGEWVTNEHGPWLRSPTGECERNLVTEGFVWRNCISLGEDKTGKMDFDSLAAMSLQLDRFKEKLDQYQIVLTVIGTLGTSLPLRVAHMPDGKLSPAGFGHLNACPAYITYRAVRDVELKRR